MYQAGKTAQVVAEMKLNKLSVLGLCETRWTGSGRMQLTTGESLIYSGHTEENAPHTEGVGLMLSKEAQGALLDWRAVSSRIITARFNSKVCKIMIVQCYAPTNSTDPDSTTEFYEILQTVLNKRAKRDLLILMGDFNAKVGSSNVGKEEVMGKNGVGEMNEDGECFSDFCSFNSLVIGGTVFEHKRIHKVTWVSPDHQTENQIDHICISDTFRRSLLDVRARRGADVGSDHHLVVGKLRLKLKRYYTETARTGTRYNTELLRDLEINEKFRVELSNRYQLLANVTEEDKTIEHEWEKIKTT